MSQDPMTAQQQPAWHLVRITPVPATTVVRAHCPGVVGGVVCDMTIGFDLARNPGYVHTCVRCGTQLRVRQALPTPQIEATNAAIGGEASVLCTNGCGDFCASQRRIVAGKVYCIPCADAIVRIGRLDHTILP